MVDIADGVDSACVASSRLFSVGGSAIVVGRVKRNETRDSVRDDHTKRGLKAHREQRE